MYVLFLTLSARQWKNGVLDAFDDRDVVLSVEYFCFDICVKTNRLCKRSLGAAEL
jgi:hypothetical protein